MVDCRLFKISHFVMLNLQVAQIYNFIRFFVFTKFHNMHFGMYKTLVMCYIIVILLSQKE
jgi:hypothetical protein